MLDQIREDNSFTHKDFDSNAFQRLFVTREVVIAVRFDGRDGLLSESCDCTHGCEKIACYENLDVKSLEKWQDLELDSQRS